jgi:hypothetical protein
LQCLKVESYGFAAKAIDEIGRLADASRGYRLRPCGPIATKSGPKLRHLVRTRTAVNLDP